MVVGCHIRIPQKQFLPFFWFHFFFKGPWFPGFLGNFRTLRFQRQFHFKQKFFPSHFLKRQKSISTLLLADVGVVTFPNLLFVTDTTELNTSAIHESIPLRMPCAGIINPSEFLDFRLATYPILGTSSTYSQNEFIISLLSLIILHNAIDIQSFSAHQF